MMDEWVQLGSLGHFSRVRSEDGWVRQVVQQALAWQETETALLACLPVFLRDRARAVCLRQDGTLVFHVRDNAAASRLRLMLPTLLPQWQTVLAGVRAAEVKIRPPEAPRQKVKQAKVSAAGAQTCLQTAAALAEFPDLAAAFRRVAARRDEP